MSIRPTPALVCRNCSHTQQTKKKQQQNKHKCAGELADHFAISAAAVSRHLSVLKEADLVRDDRRGNFIFYELNASVLEEILMWLTRLKGDDTYVENP